MAPEFYVLGRRRYNFFNGFSLFQHVFVHLFSKHARHIWVRTCREKKYQRHCRSQSYGWFLWWFLRFLWLPREALPASKLRMVPMVVPMVPMAAEVGIAGLHFWTRSSLRHS